MSIRIIELPPYQYLKDAIKCRSRVNEQTQKWRICVGKDVFCERKAKYRVNNRNLCATHAGDLLIRTALKAKKWVPVKN